MMSSMIYMIDSYWHHRSNIQCHKLDTGYLNLKHSQYGIVSISESMYNLCMKKCMLSRVTHKADMLKTEVHNLSHRSNIYLGHIDYNLHSD